MPLGKGRIRGITKEETRSEKPLQLAQAEDLAGRGIDGAAVADGKEDPSHMFEDALMEAPQTAQLMIEIEARQDELLRGLHELNTELERTLAEYQSRLKVFPQTNEPG